MRKVVTGLFISLDGVVEFPERWGFQYLDDDLNEQIIAGIAQADAVLLGPTTYRMFAAMWPRQTDDVPMAKFLNHSHKYVLSRTPDKVGHLDWAPATLLRDNLGSALRTLTAQPGKTIQVPGSPRLVRSLLQEGVLDELSFVICPVIVGSGVRLFDGLADHVQLTVERSRVSSNGAIWVTYRLSRARGQASAVAPHLAKTASSASADVTSQP